MITPAPFRPRPGYPYLAGAPLLIAHRGGSALAPENTLVAFRQAIEWWGADLLEVDVQPTADGDAVVIHDPTLDRTTSGSGPVVARTMSELKQLDAGFRFTADGGRTHPYRDRDVRLCSLAELLDAFPHHRVNVEIKDGRAQAAVSRAVDRAGAWARVLVAAGDRANRSAMNGYPGPISASGAELRAFYLLHRLGVAGAAPLGVDALQMPERHGGRQVLSPRLVRDAHARNVAVHVWTVDEVDDMERLLDWGVDGIITDRPDRLARVLHRRSGRPLPPGPEPGVLAPSVERLLRA